MDPQASESGADVATLLVSREGGRMDAPLAVSIAFSGSATPGADYVSPALTVTLPGYVPLTSITIKPVADALTEGTETVIVSLVEKKGVYSLGEGKAATATIADASAHSGGTTTPPTPQPPFALPHDRTGTLLVTMTFEGTGSWKDPRNGAYSNLKFHRTLTYTVPLTGIYSPGSGFTAIDRREPAGALALPNMKRFLVLTPRDQLLPVPRVCGHGTVDYLDESSGMEVGDPGQPPLVPFTQTIRGGGAFPSGDKTVPERDLCETAVTFDFDKHVFHLRLDGSDSNVKVLNTHNGHQMPRYNLPLQDYDGSGAAKAHFTFFDVPLPAEANTKGLSGSRVIENFNVTGGPDHSTFPLRATVKWQVTFQ
jgi:hypothetical protein